MVKLEGLGTLAFTFPKLNPNAVLYIDFVRTLRIPDDGKVYPLPPGLGNFPLKEMDKLPEIAQKRLPEKWRRWGGVLFPMYTSEALWLNFRSPALGDRVEAANPRSGAIPPFAVKVSTGMRSAVTGEPRAASLREDDYLIVPHQRWLDGFKTGNDSISQFVAVPLGSGATVEEQLSGKAEFGGIQIEAFPLKEDEFEKRFPVRPPSRPTKRYSNGGLLLSCSADKSGSDVWKGASDYERSVEFSSGPAAAAASLESMGLGAGGRMVQEIIKDPYGFDTWDREAKQRVYVHLMPALAWFGLTGQEPPLAPLSVNEYNKHKFPWFEHYSGMPTLKPTEALSKIHTVAEIDQSLLPDNVSVGIPKSMVHEIPAAKQGGIRDGDW